MEKASAGETLQDLTASLRAQLTNTQPGAGSLADRMKRSGISYEEKLQRYQEALVVARVFNTTEGREALQRLRSRTIEKPCFPWQSVQGDQILAWGCAREGQNSIVHWIEDCIEVAEKGPPQEEGDDGE